MGVGRVIAKVVGTLFLITAGSALVFAGFEIAAYQETIADREVTVDGMVTDTDVWQKPDGNWTYQIEFNYTFDQEAAITDQGLTEVYPYDMADEREYESETTGGEYDSRSEARESMEDEYDDPDNLTIYVDPFYPGEGSLEPVRSILPEAMQYGGSLFLLLGLYGLSRMARRVSA